MADLGKFVHKEQTELELHHTMAVSSGLAPTRQNQPMQATLLHRRTLLAASTLAALGASPPAQAQAPATRIWRVGMGQAVWRIADALRLAGDGDTVEIEPGNYPGDVAVILQRRLHIVGLGDGAVLQAKGLHAEGKAIWVVRNGDIRIDNITFTGCRVPSGNGAGIRFEKGRLRLQRCRFSDNQMGLLSGNDDTSELDIDDCDFSDAPVNPDSLPHLLYVGRIGRFSLRGSRLQRGHQGHLLKCRARQSVIAGNRLDDGLLGEASYEIDLPNGGIALVEGNTLVQSPRSQNPVMLAYGAESRAWDRNSLTLRGNTFINHLGPNGVFVRVWADRLPADTPVRSSGNRYLGAGSLQLGPQGESSDDSRGALPLTTPSTG
jgi:hypothetical protein